MNFFNQYEVGVLEFIRDNLHTAFGDKFFSIITHLGSAVFVIALAVVLLFFRKTRRTGITAGGALLIGFIIGNLILKPLIDRMRPFDFEEGLNIFKSITDGLGDKSFPSGHSLAVFEAAVSIWLVKGKKFGIPALVVALTVAFSRLYLCVHYPSDVLVGAILGTVFAFVSYFIVKAVFKKLFDKGLIKDYN